MFGSIARRYDLANHFLSCGCDFIWRKRAAEIVAGWNPNTIIDLATGTGDLALALAKASPKSEIIGADFSEEMLAVAKVKGVRRVVTADALALPFADRSFDCLTIAFGLRNIKDWNAALNAYDEALRLRPGDPTAAGSKPARAIRSRPIRSCSARDSSRRWRAG